MLSFFGIYWLIKRDKIAELLLLIIPILSYVVTFILLVGVVRIRHYIPIMIPVSILFGVGVYHFFLLFSGKYAIISRLTIILILINHIYRGAIEVSYAQLFNARPQLHEFLIENVTPGASILWKGKPQNFPGPKVYGEYFLMNGTYNKEYNNRGFQHIFTPLAPTYDIILTDREIDSHIPVHSVELSPKIIKNKYYKFEKKAWVKEFYIYKPSILNDIGK